MARAPSAFERRNPRGGQLPRFFGREAGQARSRNLREVEKSIMETIRYYGGPGLGDAFIPAAANTVGELSPGADFRDAVLASDELVEGVQGLDPGDTMRGLGGLGAASLGMFLGPAAKVADEAALGIAEGMARYRWNYRNNVDARYNPAFFDVEEDALRDEAGEVLGVRDVLRPRENLVDRVPAKPEEGVIYRGMSAAEYNRMRETGNIQSMGMYNIGDAQKGLSYYTTDPHAAESYANSFAPAEYMPTFDRPAYVVAVRRPPDNRLRAVQGTAGHEVGVMGAIPTSDVVGVYRGDVVDYVSGTDTPIYKRKPSARLHWQRVKSGGD